MGNTGSSKELESVENLPRIRPGSQSEKMKGNHPRVKNDGQNGKVAFKDKFILFNNLTSIRKIDSV